MTTNNRSQVDMFVTYTTFAVALVIGLGIEIVRSL